MFTRLKHVHKHLETDKFEHIFSILKSKIIKIRQNMVGTLKSGRGSSKQYYDIINLNIGFSEMNKKLEEIKKNNQNLHKKFIRSLGKHDKNGRPRYENIIEDVYRRIENRNKGMDKSENKEAKELLDEVKSNAMNAFEFLIKELQNKGRKYVQISASRISTLIKLLRGDCFLFGTTVDGDPRHVQFDRRWIRFDKEYATEEVSRQISQYENSQDTQKDIQISRRHIYRGANLDTMRDILSKYKKLISYYFKDIKPYVVSATWLNDTDFFDYYSKYLSERGEMDPEDEKTYKKIIRNIKLTQELSIGKIKLKTLEKKNIPYEKRREALVKKNNSSLDNALAEYEEKGNQLRNGRTVMDLTKIN